MLERADSERIEQVITHRINKMPSSINATGLRKEQILTILHTINDIIVSEKHKATASKLLNLYKEKFLELDMNDSKFIMFLYEITKFQNIPKEMFSFLIKRLEFNINKKNSYGYLTQITPLMIAINAKNINMIDALLEFPSLRLSTQDSDGNTALHYVSQISYAQEAGNDEIKKEYFFGLIKRMIDRNPRLPYIKNKDGMGPGNEKKIGPGRTRQLIKTRKMAFFPPKNTNLVGGRRKTRRNVK
jgi:hypothetical protein